jgi:hypothetical protein
VGHKEKMIFKIPDKQRDLIEIAGGPQLKREHEERVIE